MNIKHFSIWFFQASYCYLSYHPQCSFSFVMKVPHFFLFSFSYLLYLVIFIFRVSSCLSPPWWGGGLPWWLQVKNTSKYLEQDSHMRESAVFNISWFRTFNIIFFIPSIHMQILFFHSRIRFHDVLVQHFHSPSFSCGILGSSPS